MDKCIYDENNGLWYELQGEYYLPYHPKKKNLWGYGHIRCLKEHRKRPAQRFRMDRQNA